MNTFISSIVIPSKNKSLSMSFYSTVFDSEVEIDCSGEDFISLFGQRFIFVESDEYTSNGVPMAFIDMSLESFNALIQKIEFYYYTKGAQASMTNTENSFKDPDGNVWGVNLVDRVFLSDTLTENVRN